MAEETETKEMKIEITLRNPQAIEIVKNLPKEIREEIIEKYVIIGDTVLRYATIAPSKESIETLLQPVLTELKSKADIIGTVGAQISQIVPILGKTAKKGEISCESIYRDLSTNFRDDEFEDVSEKGKFTDIKAVPKDAGEPVLIEVKEYTNDVPTHEVEKFWRDMDIQRTSYGIFVSMRARIMKVTDDIKIVPRGDKTAIFVVNEKLGWCGHGLAYYVAKKLMEAKRGTVEILEKDKLTQALTRLSGDLRRIKDEIQNTAEIIDTAKSLQKDSTEKLTKIVEKAASLRTSIDTIIENAFKEIS